MVENVNNLSLNESQIIENLDKRTVTIALN